jgi:hypothetical protein
MRQAGEVFLAGSETGGPSRAPIRSIASSNVKKKSIKLGEPDQWMVSIVD